MLLFLKSHQHLLINLCQSILLIGMINIPNKHQSLYASSIKKNLPRDEIWNKIHDYVRGLIDNNINCLNWNNGRPASCSCIKKFRDDKCFNQLLEKLDKYKMKESEGRKLFLHGVLTHGNLKKESYVEVKREVVFIHIPESRAMIRIQSSYAIIL